MVFNKFTHLARPSLGKTLTHGYAQSLVAATQSTAPFPLPKAHGNNKSGRPSTAQHHTHFSTLPASSATPGRAAHQPADTTHNQDGGLQAYYDAWHKIHQHGGDSREWKQFQFPKLIELKPQQKTKESVGRANVDHIARAETLGGRGSLDRAQSTSAVDDIKKGEEKGEEAAIAQVNEAIATVTKQIQGNSEELDAAPHASQTPRQKETTQLIADQVDLAVNQHASTQTENSSASSPPLSDVTATISSPTDPACQVHLQRIKDLHDAHAFKDIPPAFESMLSEGVVPTVDAYNALLASAIHLPMGRNELVPKALGIYSDMLRRKVSPDGEFYSTLIKVLSRRALQVANTKDDLVKRRNRYRGAHTDGGFLLASDAAEYAIIAEDDALVNAVRLFNTASSKHKNSILPAETYALLIHACARHLRVQDMVQAYQHMESQGVRPISTIFPAMISAFSKNRDLESATECYNKYRSLAVKDDAGEFAIIGRNDGQVYSALVKGYASCGKSEAGQRFLARVVDSFASSTGERRLQLKQIQDEVNLEAVIQNHLDSGDFAAAWTAANGELISQKLFGKALANLCVAAADSSDIRMASQAYDKISSTMTPSFAVSTAMMAMYIRHQDIETATKHWEILTTTAAPQVSLLEPTASFAEALIRYGRVDEALTYTRETFSRIRAGTSTMPAELVDQIDEIIEMLARAVAESKQPVSAAASMTMLWTMGENGGLISSVTEHVLAHLCPEHVASLNRQDTVLVLKAQAAFIGDSATEGDIAHASRLDHLIQLATGTGIALDQQTTVLVDRATEKLASQRPDLLEKWSGYKRGLLEPAQIPITPLASPSIQPLVPTTDNFDPYAATTDYRGSTLIIEELENRRNAQGLKEALTRFRNIRRAGRHPRYIVYGKLIASAAKEGRINLTHDILGMARNDVPYLPEYSVVRHGWSSILDAMVGACLTAGKRVLAEQYHQELLDQGSTPSANTYGLYITTLRASIKTFDEATEAVKIFHRAVSEGVLPSSFLYNALIGKLGKARRIDDCLRYFQEMRAAGVRPTSVTYGTIVNALCRVSDERFAEELFDEMESMPNYKPRPAPYNSLMQYFLTSKRDSQKVLAYYNRMRSMNIEPTMHTYKLLIDTYATLEPINLSAAEGVLDRIRAQGLQPEAVHYASLIHAKGCVMHDMQGARETFDGALASKDFPPQACLYQALFEAMVANHRVADTEVILDSMSTHGLGMTPYIANTLIHGWATENQIAKSKAVYDSVGTENREPSTYESMTRAFLTAEDRKGALAVVHEMLSRGYPSAVSNKIVELVGHGVNRAVSAIWPNIIA